MKYELKKWSYNGSPTDNKDDTFNQPIIIQVKIVGDDYGFLAPDPMKDMTTVVLPNVGKDGKQLDALCEAAAIELVKKQYPDKE